MTIRQTILSIFFVLLCTIDALATKPHHPATPSAVLAIPAAWERYEQEIKKFPKQIKQFNERIQKIDDPVSYKGWKALDPSTGKKQKFADLNPVSKQVLYLYNAEMLEATLAKKSVEWLKIEIYLLSYPSLILLPPNATDVQKKKAEEQESQNKKARQKMAEELKQLNVQLKNTRTQLAIKRVQILESMIKKHKDKNFAEELKRYLDHTKKYYNKIGLKTEAPKEKKKETPKEKK